MGCAANSRRTARARSRRFRTHRVALPARPAAEPVTDLAHIYRESLGPVRIQHANVVTRRAGDDLVDALPRTYQPVSSDWLRGSRPCALLSRHVSVRTPGLGSPCTQDHCRDRTGMRRSAAYCPKTWPSRMEATRHGSNSSIGRRSVGVGEVHRVHQRARTAESTRC